MRSGSLERVSHVCAYSILLPHSFLLSTATHHLVECDFIGSSHHLSVLEKMRSYCHLCYCADGGVAIFQLARPCVYKTAVLEFAKRQCSVLHFSHALHF